MTLASFLTAAYTLANDKARRVGVDRMTEQSDLNSGKEWSKKDLFLCATDRARPHPSPTSPPSCRAPKRRSARRQPSLGSHCLTSLPRAHFFAGA